MKVWKAMHILSNPYNITDFFIFSDITLRILIINFRIFHKSLSKS